MTRFAVVLVLVFSLHAPVSADDWPRFRGSDGSGVGDAAGLPVEFGPESHVAWKTSVPFGRSSPIVAAGAIYLTAADDEALWVLAFDEVTGKERWRHRVERPRRSEVYPANDTASPTPASDGKAVYAFFPDFGLVAVSAEGKELWRQPLGPFESFYGMAASPILEGDTLLMLCDQRQGSYLLALDKKSGEEKWRAQRDRMYAWSTPVVAQSRSGAVVLVVGSLWVDAYALADGRSLWSWPGVGADVVASPFYRDGRLYTLSGGGYELPSFDSVLEMDQNKDGKIDQAENDASEDMRGHFGFYDDDGDGYITREEWKFLAEFMGKDTWGLQVVDLADPATAPEKGRWTHQKSLSNIPTPVLYGDVLYTVRGGGIFTSFDSETGEVIKRDRLTGALGDYYPSLVAADGKIFAASNDGKVVVIEAQPEWQVIRVNDLGESIDATPAIANGRLLVRTEGTLYAFASE